MVPIVMDSTVYRQRAACALTGDLTSSSCICGCVVNGVSAYGSDMSILYITSVELTQAQPNSGALT